MKRSKLLPLLFALSCSLSGATEQPNFIVFIADDISWDDFSCYGDPNVDTAHIDGLAEEGMKFTNAFLTISSCSPSRHSIIQSRYPHNTGAAELHTTGPNYLSSLPEVLKEAGYYTVSSGKFHMGGNVHRGFDQVVQEGTGHSGAKKWVDHLKERPIDQPFFAWYAAHDAHRGWDEGEFHRTHDPDNIIIPDYYPDTPPVRADFAKYYDEVYRFDQNIGRVVAELKAQGVLENTVIVVMADNGRAFPHAKTRVNDRGLKTPFVIYGNDLIEQTGTTSDALLSVIDLGPTILEIAGIDSPDWMQGVSFLELLSDPDAEFRNYVFGEHNWHDYESYERMVRTKDFLFIMNARPQFDALGAQDVNTSPTAREIRRLYEAGELNERMADTHRAPRPVFELYDLCEDPEQWHNVAGDPDYAAKQAAMMTVLYRWMVVTGDSIPENLTPSQFDRDSYEMYFDRSVMKRGTMPGADRDATKINATGPF